MLTTTVAAIFTFLAVVHLYWLCGGRAGKSAAIPEIGGHAAFTPSAPATATVAAGLFLSAILVAALGGVLALPVRGGVLRAMGYLLSAALCARAIGDMRLVGFFKRVRGTRLAKLDTVLYSPLCLGLGLSVIAIVSHLAA